MSSIVTRRAINYNDISRNQYGTDEYASLISDANPDIVTTDGLVAAGSTIFIPPIIPNTFTPGPENNDSVTLVVDGQELKFWESLTISYNNRLDQSG